MYFGTFYHPGPKSDECTCRVKRNRTHGHVKFEQAFYLQTNLLHQLLYPLYPPYFTFNITTFTTKPNHILHLELFLELSFVNSSNTLFIPFGVNPLLLLLLYINFVASTSRLSLSSKACHQFITAVEYGLFFYKT